MEFNASVACQYICPYRHIYIPSGKVAGWDAAGIWGCGAAANCGWLRVFQKLVYELLVAST